MKHGCLILSCGSVQLALPVECIVEVSRMVAPCARLLRVPGYVLGVVDFHGELVPLLDLPARLGLTVPRTPEATERALVLNPMQLISVVTRARIGDELAELAGGQL